MINITIYKQLNGNYLGFDSKGHASYAPYGEDIVCAGASALVLNFINCVEHFTKDSFQLESDEESGIIHFKFDHEPSEQGKLLFDSMVFGLVGIQQNYDKKYIILKFREV